ncbi:ABC transporter substrate-binding protein [Bdellovibrio bacteriovorus]|uniref:ABC transporter substrate-binding protein n=1 Tax=Bdellovibrio bacteriovorus TaxID=959 RepID=UPI0021D32DB4|nr:ABC transporter substrate-binding protein [Bdellovibrio bacteriovorus]UXR63526.1 ABC transporter substrate-binding protein [Bdellovibrio bacteriovorus]
MSMKLQKTFGIETQLLLGRFLTRSGDQAWDFVVPFALLHVFPGKLQIAAFYYLIIKLGTFFLTPSAGQWIDSTQRRRVVRFGICVQFFAVFGGMICFYTLDRFVHAGNGSPSVGAVISLFSLLAVFGVMASLGSLITDISVGNDLVPTLVSSHRLTQFNSWLRRIDLGTEVGAPIAAGALFAFSSSHIHLAGLLLIAVWNLISFVPEYVLLQNVIKKSGLQIKKNGTAKKWKELLGLNVQESVSNPLFWLIFSYALLWLSVLSPHGVLLAGYLKDRVSLPEAEIGVFRGLGAVFGLISTVTFPYLVARRGLIASSKLHLGFQGMTLTVGICAFAWGSSLLSVYVFLGCILLSRVGLYGFSNGEFELRQRLIPEGQRGELNSLSSLTTTFATLILFGMGSLLPNTADFKYLVYISLGAVLLANIVFLRWVRQYNHALSVSALPEKS